MVGADLIRGPVGMVLGLIVWLVVFSLLLGAINGWYLQSIDAGVVSSERFDRVIPKADTDKSADNRWAKLTGVGTLAAAATSLTNTTVYLIVQDDTPGSTKCEISTGGVTRTATTSFDGTAYTPLGTEVKYSVGATADDPVLISGCTFSEAGSVFNAGGLGGLVKIILQAAGLAPPIALLFALGTFGTSFLRNMGSHPILAAVLTVITMLLVATLLNTFVPFLTSAFTAIDKNRFVMYDEGLGNVAIVVGNFYGVVVVASMMMIAWTLIKSIRTRNVITSTQRM